MTYEKSDENMMNWTGKGDEKLQELVNLVYIESGPESSGKVQPLQRQVRQPPGTLTLMNSFQSSASNELFLERLDAFTAKTLADIKAFSTRENIPYDQVGCDPLFHHNRAIT